MKVSKLMLLFIAIVAALAFFEVAQLMGWLSYTMVVTHIVGFVFALLLVSILSIIGAIFLGAYVAHRVFSDQAFTPFEEEMLTMRRDVAQIKKDLEELRSRK